MNQELKYYIHNDDIIIFPKINFCYRSEKSDIFIFEWIQFLNFFKTLSDRFEFFIIRCLINDYSHLENKYTARNIITKIVINLNIYIFDIIHFEYFNSFDDTINRFRYLFKTVNENFTFSSKKKTKFIFFLISFLELMEELNEIFENNYIKYSSGNFFDKFLPYYEKKVDIEFIPIAGGIYQEKKLKSFWISKNLITNCQYLEFINNYGYDSKYFWSKEGLYWLRFHNYSHPKNWVKVDDTWYINGIQINDILNLPVTKISYYEAEAFAKFKECEIPSEEEWDWVSSNRNKTQYPTGLELCSPFGFLYNTNLRSVTSDMYKSLLGVNQLYGNAWQYTKTITKDDNSKVCVKGGDYIIPMFILNNMLKMNVPIENRKHNIGFRIIKY